MTANACPIANLCNDCSVLRFDDEQLLGPHFLENEPVRLPIDYEVTDRGPDFLYLEQTAQNGCEFCILLRQVLTEELQDLGLPTQRIRLYYHWRHDGPFLSGFGLSFLSAEVISWQGHHYSYRAAIADSVPAPKVRQFVFEVETNHHGVRDLLKTPSLRQRETLGDENIEFISRAIRTCISSCQHRVVFRHLPTRLLKVGANQNGLLKLVETAEMHTQHGSEGDLPKYIALSYCWGEARETNPQLKTTHSNLAEHKIGVAEHNLPQALQDAVRICRMLSIRYLWVDCLCIIQGDKVDWERESALMGRIYNNAFLTIIAASSPASDVGFLQRRRRDVAVKFQSKRDPSISGHFHLVYSGKLHGRSTVTFGWPGDDVDGTPWNNRGWTLQEGIMSNRQLIFGKNMVHFQCETGTQSENGYTNIKGSTPGSSIQSFLYTREQGFEVGMYETWHFMLLSYGRRSFTVAEDKLPAISGTANLMAMLCNIPSEDYLAGIWREDLPYSIIWWSESWSDGEPAANVSELADRLRCPNPYIAPSWSPISQGIITNLELKEISRSDFTSECVILNAWTAIRGSDPFGQVQYGGLRIQAKMGLAPSKLIRGHCDKTSRYRNWQIRADDSIERILAYCFFAGHLKWDDQEADGIIMLMVGSTVAAEDWLHKSWEKLEARREDCPECNQNSRLHHYVLDGGNGHLVESDPQHRIWRDAQASDNVERIDPAPEKPAAEKRDYWGILLHKWQVSGKYVRIGVWLSSAYDRKDLDFFQDWKTGEVEII